MTLRVDVVSLGEDGYFNATDLVPEPPHNDLFGVMRDRAEWARMAGEVGLPLFARVAEPLPIFYESAELEALATEVTRLIAHLPSLVPPVAVETYAFRLRNLQEAIRLARTIPEARGGVEIG